MKQIGLIRKRVRDLGYLTQRVTQVEPVDPSAMGTSLVIGELTDREVRHEGSGSEGRRRDARRNVSTKFDDTQNRRLMIATVDLRSNIAHTRNPL